MKRRRSTPETCLSKSSSWVPSDLVKPLCIVGLLSALGAAAVGVFSAWDQLFPVPKNLLVKVYRVHGCPCVFDWVQTLETQGFVVKMIEVNSLKRIRNSLHVPDKMKGCHVASFLQYFVEGHVAPQALRNLARDHPLGIGVATDASIAAALKGGRPPDDEHCPVYLLTADAKSKLWFEPTR